MPAAEDPVKRLLNSYTVDDVTGCWNCRYFAKPRGYPTIKVYGRCTGAHRFSYEVHKGRIPEGAHVLHSCDNPRCINPDHLSIGTHAQNMREAFERGRQKVGIEKQGAMPVLINGQVFGSLHDAERKLGVHRSTITKRIKRGTPGFRAITREEYLNAQ